jgi:hypothetical protein
MSLATVIRDQIESTPSHRAAQIRAVDDELRVEVKLTDHSRLGCLLESLHFEYEGSVPAPFEPCLILDRVNYLGERLEVIETESNAGRTILRSKPPRAEGGVISFFEMELNGARTLSLVRFSYDPEIGKRVRIPAPLTRDALERLIRDLIELTRDN